MQTIKEIEYANAYTEVLEILKYISQEDYNKIPKEKIEFFETNSNKDYDFFYNPYKTLNEQRVSKRAKAIISILFRDYWASDEQRETIKKIQFNNREKIENLKKEEYNTDNLFERKSIIHQNIPMSKKIMVKTEDGLFMKLIKKIKSLFYKKNNK